MESARFSQVESALQSLIDAGIENLDSLSDDIRADGLPQNWVDDIPNLDAGQKTELRALLFDSTYQWCISLHNLLLTQ
jgi:translation elongation factor EF-4